MSAEGSLYRVYGQIDRRKGRCFDGLCYKVFIINVLVFRLYSQLREVSIRFTARTPTNSGKNSPPNTHKNRKAAEHKFLFNK